MDLSFEHRSGRVISLGRVILAAIFLMAIFVDPSQPSIAPVETYSILAAYLVFAVYYLAVAWNNWWFQSRVATIAHAIDIAMYGIMVFLAEGYTSPFFTFFMFILLSATIKWGWRETAYTAAVLMVVFFAAGGASVLWGNGHFELQRFLIRGGYLVVLSLILIWFGVTHRPRGGRAQPERHGEPLTRQAVRSVARRLLATRIVTIWSDEEEPWLNISIYKDGLFDCQQVGPTEFARLTHETLPSQPFLFDLRKSRLLVAESDGSLKRSRAEGVLDSQLAARFDLDEGIVYPFQSEHFTGLVIAVGIPGLAPDHLRDASLVSDIISAALERHHAIRDVQQVAEARTRLSLARDLHDSVVQVLAGTAFRLEAMVAAAKAGRDIEGDARELQRELSEEQRHLRGFITALRGGGAERGLADVCGGVKVLATRLERQWGITCTVACPPLEARRVLEHDLHQMIREAVANAVRHGKANQIELSIGTDAEGLHLRVSDNGRGFDVALKANADAPDETKPGPWSLYERTRSLGGSLAVMSSRAGSQVLITLPLGETA